MLMSQPDHTTRRRFLTYLSYAGVGAIGSVIVPTLNSCEDTTTNSSPDDFLSSKREESSISLSTNEIITVDAQGNIISRRPLPPLQTLTDDLDKSTKLEMVLIPGGKFTMGSPTSELGRGNDEGPQHEVSVPAFYLGKYPVMQAQWEAIMGSNPSRFRGARRPVEHVSWEDAVEFCQKLSEKSDKDYRLPSEAEWEYACRAETTTPFHFGETITPALANYNSNNTYGSSPVGDYRGQTTEVGGFPPNAFGLYNMHGNVWEWCQDAHHKTYAGAPTDGSAWINEKENETRVLRGGSWLSNPRDCRSAYRDGLTPGNRLISLGFRIAYSAPPNLP